MEVIRTIDELCQIYTATGHGGTEEVASIIKQVLPDAGLLLKPSASPGAADDILLKLQGQGEQSLLLLGHYDTVPRSPGQVTKKDGERMYALGSYDMKGGVALALLLASELSPKDYQELHLLFTGDEEWRAAPLILDEGEYAGILAFEGAEEGGLTTERFGAGILEIRVLGQTLRATYPVDGPSTILGLTRLLHTLEENNNKDCHFTATSLEAESAINVIPDEVFAKGVLRYRTQSDREAYLRRIPREEGGLELAISYHEIVPPLDNNQKAVELLDSLDIPHASRVGAADISWLSGISPILIDGLGPFGGGDHSAKEWISLASLGKQAERARQIAQKILLS